MNRLRGWMERSSDGWVDKRLSSPNCRDRLWGPSSLPFIGNRDSFLGVKRSGREVDHSSPSSLEFEWAELYLHFPCMPSWCGQGWLYFFTGHWLPVSYSLWGTRGKQHCGEAPSNIVRDTETLLVRFRFGFSSCGCSKFDNDSLFVKLETNRIFHCVAAERKRVLSHGNNFFSTFIGQGNSSCDEYSSK